MRGGGPRNGIGRSSRLVGRGGSAGDSSLPSSPSLYGSDARSGRGSGSTAMPCTAPSPSRARRRSRNGSHGKAFAGRMSNRSRPAGTSGGNRSARTPRLMTGFGSRIWSSLSFARSKRACASRSGARSPIGRSVNVPCSCPNRTTNACTPPSRAATNAARSASIRRSGNNKVVWLVISHGNSIIASNRSGGW